ncbi:MAG: M48 family metallopeptidase [Betaproteobacteria bacterium]|jgi:STE24 endopeptidase|nr:M48 family metallopeptidase [Betaproteobacteria bacterium]MBK7275538.1 M48 family metallopeptidase [Betaproteobacteria bacterium]MBK7458880.1 M48 family metallopeptidase [Betaproteobacteria bacterium]MBK7514724.1 M48 family metallopeptidase [Betaproteobacteria bacterium]MBK8107216.1 M48 family metallopeptidase [Betaproteobacteria bacterium]
MQPALFTWAFVAALLLSLGVKFWLATRQMRHVAAHRDQVPAAFSGTVTLPAHRKAADYTLAKGRFGLLTTAFGTAVLLGWTLLGGLDALNVLLRDLVPPAWGHLAYQLALLAAFAIIGGLLDLPLEWYGTFRIEQRFGFNRMTLKMWFTDMAKGTAVGAVIGLPLAALMLWIMGASGGLWWLWAWVAWVAFNLALLVLYPTVIAPIFNKFEPLADDALRARVQALMQRCGFAAKGLFVMDGSKRSAHANAYFTGLGAAKRVVFFDTLLQRLTPGEVEAVLAHELGHFKHKHVMQRMVGIFGFSLAGLALLGWLAGQSGFYAGLGVAPNLTAPNDALALLLFMLALPPITFFVSPLMAHFSRRHEFQADAYACGQADGRDLARALLKLHEDNASTLTPDPVYVRFYYSHPPASERLAALPHPQPLPA